MVELFEREVVAFFAGKKVNPLRVSSILYNSRQGYGNYHDCVEYVINISELEENSGTFKRAYRNLKNLDLMLFIYLNYNTIKGVRILKYKTLIYPDGVTSGYETTPSPDDVKFINHVLNFIVQEEEREDTYESN